MNELPWIEIISAVVVLAGGGGIAGLLAARRRRRHQEDDGGRAPQAGTGTATAPRPVETAEPETAEPGAAAPEAAAPAPAEPEVAPAPTVETPAPTAGRLVRLRDRLARSGSPLGARLLSVLSRDSLTEDDWDEIEEELLLADVGAGPTTELLDALRTKVRVLGVREPAAVRDLLRSELVALLDPGMDRALRTEPTTAEDGTHLPAVTLVVGVNGTGKTTTVGKLARVLVADGRSVVLGAADTFRAAAADQLTTWGNRVGVPTVRSDREGADPASVAFEAVARGRDDKADVVLVDTAGRLQNKAGLMDELGKIVRVASKVAAPSEVLLVLDATTGQNGLSQARVFAEVAGVTGIVLTKLDGTAKGGIVVQVQRELGVPVKLVGLGEGPDDLAPFEVEEFVDGILG
ncbi:signal recognition particle-docking protein FtsY [Promicromonospora thailandica]|uniref:Signal recognition particle receptor FtsY n=1 Tax=Promicromonospora thailandica TaxID=765201 RepID=A0A9X2G182_9MICO|nr:signal recognition particle-docking protein FtsY [Promicromonospora thailandica]MCP2263813.1 fused signal recognition particle receptor [Promicromonospora thailandica]BFF17895.1 signal recognition particle-docking protein FtsY [Promicromonospora thailandica]